MARVSPWYAVKSDVYHNNTDCTEGNNIEPENKRAGNGNKRICSHCKRLNAKK